MISINTPLIKHMVHNTFNNSILRCAIAVCFMLFLASCTGSRSLTEGVISQHRYFTGADSFSPPNTGVDTFLHPPSYSKIWFSDSSVVYEVKVFNGINFVTENGTFRETSYDVFKYTYLDLRTFRCQDYLSFSDTALPVCNYVLEKDEILNWKFYSKNPIDLEGTMTNLPDTFIKGKKYKRDQFTNVQHGFKSGFIYYYDCSSKPHIFHINKSLDEMNPGCKVVKSEMYDEFDTSVKYVFDLKVEKKKLSKHEREIFKTWAKNAITTQLPLTSLSDANKRCGPNIKKFPGDHR